MKNHKMKNKYIFSLLLTMTLLGCGEEQPIDKISNVKGSSSGKWYEEYQSVNSQLTEEIKISISKFRGLGITVKGECDLIEDFWDEKNHKTITFNGKSFQFTELCHEKLSVTTFTPRTEDRSTLQSIFSSKSSVTMNGFEILTGRQFANAFRNLPKNEEEEKCREIAMENIMSRRPESSNIFVQSYLNLSKDAAICTILYSHPDPRARVHVQAVANVEIFKDTGRYRFRLLN